MFMKFWIVIIIFTTALGIPLAFADDKPVTPPAVKEPNPYFHKLQDGEKPPEGSTVVTDPHAKPKEPAQGAGKDAGKSAGQTPNPAAPKQNSDGTYQGTGVNKDGTHTSLFGKFTNDILDVEPPPPPKKEGGPLGTNSGTWIHTPEGGHVTVTMKDGSKKEVYIKKDGWYQVPDGATSLDGHLSSTMSEHIKVYQGDPKSFGKDDQDKNFPFKQDIGDAGKLNQMMTPDRFKSEADKKKDTQKFNLKEELPPPDSKTKVSLPSSDEFGDSVGMNNPGGQPNSRDILEDTEHQEKHDEHHYDVL